MDFLQLMINSQNSKEMDTHKGKREELQRAIDEVAQKEGVVPRCGGRFLADGILAN